MAVEPLISVVIPTFNGRELLKRFLPSVLSAAESYPGEAEVIVVDDGSSDGTVEWLKEEYPGVKALALPGNVGFGEACNRGIFAARGGVIVLLNNDVEVISDIFGCTASLFGGDAVFAAAFDMLDRDSDMPYANRILPVWRMGLLTFEMNGKKSGPGASFYGCGGGMALSREKYLALSGFDPVFRPYYWEDTDLSYRAWKRGWKTVFSPECVVRHHPSSTIKRVADARKTGVINQRNRLLFLWKNLTDPKMLAEHLIWLPAHLLSALRRRDTVFIRGVLAALKRLPRIISARKREKRGARASDREIFAIFAG